MSDSQFSRQWQLGVNTLFFLSGSTGLIFEVLWTRLISSLVGGTAIAMTCVFMVYIVALSLGARIAGSVKATGKRALLYYGVVEALVGLLGFALTMLMLHERALIIDVAAATVGLEGIWSWVLISTAIVGPPATLMGLTLPLALNALSGYVSARKHLTTIYGINILGGGCGALLTGFVLLWQLGVTGSALLAMGINLTIAVVALIAFLKVEEGSNVEDASASSGDQTPEDDAVAGEVGEGVSLGTWAKWLFLAIAFFGGLASLGYELLWGRISKFILGDRTMATSTLLAIYLSCMALGSFEVERFARLFGWKTPRQLFTSSALILLLAALAHPVFWWVTQEVMTSAIGVWLVSPGHTLERMVAMMLLVVVPAGLLGISFPLLMYSARELEVLPSAVVGRLYFVNSIGAAGGSLLGGYFLPRWIGTAGGFATFSVVLVVIAAGTLAVVYFKEKESAEDEGGASMLRALRPHGVILVLLAVTLVVMPRTLHFKTPEDKLLDSAEDEYGIQMTLRDPDGSLQVMNNRVYIAYKLGKKVTNLTQEVIAYASCMFAKECGSVLNIGTGYGITAGAYTMMEGVEQIVTIEMLPYVFHNQRMYEPQNNHYLDDKRVERILGDGRQYLTRSDKKWDVISVNVMDPYMPGSSELFTLEFWEIAREKIAPGGVYCQLVFGKDVERLVLGLQQVFGTVLLFEAYKGSYNVIAFPEPLEDPDALAPKLERMTPEARAAFKQVRDVNVDTYWPEQTRAALERSRAIAKKYEGKELLLHSDNWPVLEYQWSQGMSSLSLFDSMQAYDYE